MFGMQHMIFDFCEYYEFQGINFGATRVSSSLHPPCSPDNKERYNMASLMSPSTLPPSPLEEYANGGTTLMV